MSQEQEQEQQQEKQQEVEEEEEEEVFMKKKYSTKKQTHALWDFLQLQYGPDKIRAFYQASQFCIYKDSLFYNSGKPIHFPSYMMLSENYFHRVWTLTAHRRLKNIIVIMEWIPNSADLEVMAATDLPGDEVTILTSEQEMSMRRSFEMFNHGKSGALSPAELREVLRALDVNVSDEEELMEYMHLFADPNTQMIGFEEWRSLMVYQTFAKVQARRYYVALSLEEAETVRGIIHSRDLQSIFGHPNTSIGLRVGSILLDSTQGFTTAPPSQQITAESCYRYMNSDMYFVDEEMGNLVRALQFTPPERRESYFQELRSCRRRKRKEWQITPLATLFAQPDYYALVDFRSIIIAVRTLIKIKGMKLLDAFRAFDYNRDGRLSCSELYGGLEWLGMSLTPEDIYAIVRHVDKTGNGFIFYEHFEASFKDPEEDDQLNSMIQRVQKQENSDGWLMDDADGFKTANVAPKKIKELSAGEEKEDEQRQEEIVAHHLPKLSVSIEKVATHSFVWNSRGTLTRKDLSIWAGVNPTAILRGRNKARINLGHYAASGYGKPEKNIAPGSIGSLTLEITDTEVSTMFRSANLTLPKLNWLCPHPVNYKLSWNLVAKDFTLYVWRPIPPDANHVALGMYATITTDPPPLTAMRCIPKGWVQQVQKEPKMLWDDSGIGGRRGSVWQVNSLHLLYAKEGYDPPEGPFFEILGKKFAASEGLIAIIEGMETNKKPPPIDSQPNFLEDARPGSAANPMGGGMPIPVMPARVKNAYKQEVRLTRALREANEQAEALSFFNNRSVIPLAAMPVLAFHAQAPESMAEEIAAHNAQFMPQQPQHQSYGQQAGALASQAGAFVGDATHMLGNAAAAVSSGVQAGAALAVTGAKAAAVEAERQRKQAAAAASGLFKGIDPNQGGVKPSASQPVMPKPKDTHNMLTPGPVPKKASPPNHQSPIQTGNAAASGQFDGMTIKDQANPGTGLDMFAGTSPAPQAGMGKSMSSDPFFPSAPAAAPTPVKPPPQPVDLFAGTSQKSALPADLFAGTTTKSPPPDLFSSGSTTPPSGVVRTSDTDIFNMTPAPAARSGFSSGSNSSSSPVLSKAAPVGPKLTAGEKAEADKVKQAAGLFAGTQQGTKKPAAGPAGGGDMFGGLTTKEIPRLKPPPGDTQNGNSGGMMDLFAGTTVQQPPPSTSTTDLSFLNSPTNSSGQRPNSGGFGFGPLGGSQQAPGPLGPQVLGRSAAGPLGRGGPLGPLGPPLGTQQPNGGGRGGPLGPPGAQQPGQQGVSNDLFALMGAPPPKK